LERTTLAKIYKVERENEHAQNTCVAHIGITSAWTLVMGIVAEELGVVASLEQVLD
jgi:hypothetical protein